MEILTYLSKGALVDAIRDLPFMGLATPRFHEEKELASLKVKYLKSIEVSIIQKDPHGSDVNPQRDASKATIHDPQDPQERARLYICKKGLRKTD